MEEIDTWDKVLEKKKMLECQFWKRNKEPTEWLEKAPECKKCKDRFQCLAMKAVRFKLTVVNTIWTTYEVFAENAEEVRDLLFDWGSDEPLMREVKSDGTDSDMEIEVWND